MPDVHTDKNTYNQNISQLAGVQCGVGPCQVSPSKYDYLFALTACKPDTMRGDERAVCGGPG